MRTLHLFAGIGGGLLADLILGHEPVAAVEWDSYCCAVLRERAADGWFPGLRVHECDVRLFDPSEYAGEVDCIHAGFPCQDISVAGRQAGMGEGTRSGLYREILRIAGVVRPRYLFLENVSAILSGGLGAVLGDLAGMGYDTRWCCIRASDVGAPHKRERWWLLAYPNSLRELQPQGSKQNQWGRISDCGKNLADAISAGQQDSEGRRGVNALGTEPLITQAAESEKKNDGRLNPVFVEWLMGFPPGWTELKDLEIHKSRSKRRQPSVSCGTKLGGV